MKIIFRLSKDIYGTITIVTKKIKVLKKILNRLFFNYQEVLENKMKSSDFVFHYVDELSYLRHKIT